MPVSSRFQSKGRGALLGPLGVALAVGLAAFAVNAPACSVPVYRYALERWAADPYGVLVFHRGALSAEQQKLADRLSPNTREESEMVNLQAHVADLDSELDPKLRELWEKQKDATLPWMMLYYPTQSGIQDVVWSGKLSAANVTRMIDSPARREIARRLLTQNSAVWALLETGDKERDDAAARLLDERIALLEKELKLPEIAAQDVAEGLLNIPEEQLKISFSSVRVSRKDPAEAVFVEQLLGMEPDLRELREPMVFPIFGRGRALYALVGAGINAENIRDAGSFLIGPCSCQVKEQNPGVDVLLAVNWDKLVQFQVDVDKELPPLSGFLAMNDEKEKPAATKTEVADTAAEPDNASADMENVTEAGADTDVATAPDSEAEVSPSSSFGLLVIGAMAAVVLLVGFFLFGRNA